MLVSTTNFYIGELVHPPVLNVYYGDSPYKTFFYGAFLNLYGGGQQTVFSPVTSSDSAKTAVLHFTHTLYYNYNLLEYQ